MNIDDLSKSQLLLLTLLVNFVMSIATGIVTVSLLDQAPATITQTVNRIVEHTVETVAPASQAAAVVNTDPQPTEEDLLVAAIASDAARTVYLAADDATTTPAVAQGIYLPKSRAIVVIDDPSLPKDGFVRFPNGTVSQVSVSHANGVLAIYGFSDAAALPSAPAAPLLASESIKQGQAVIALLADGSAVTGIISKVEGTNITTTLPATPKGAAALTLRGDIAGIQTGAGTFITASEINTLLSAQ